MTEKDLDLSKIAITDDVYLYFWIYFLKPILDYDTTYKKFLKKNSWVEIDENQFLENKKFIKFTGNSRKIYFWHIFLNNFIQFF